MTTFSKTQVEAEETPLPLKTGFKWAACCRMENCTWLVNGRLFAGLLMCYWVLPCLYSSTTCEKQYFNDLIQLFPDNEDNYETSSFMFNFPLGKSLVLLLHPSLNINCLKDTVFVVIWAKISYHTMWQQSNKHTIRANIISTVQNAKYYWHFFIRDSYL